MDNPGSFSRFYKLVILPHSLWVKSKGFLSIPSFNFILRNCNKYAGFTCYCTLYIQIQGLQVTVHCTYTYSVYRLLYIVHTNTGLTGYCTLYITNTGFTGYCALNNCNNCIITYNWTYYYTVTYKPWTYYYTVTYKPWTYYCTVTYETCLYITRQDNSPYLGYFTPNLPNVFSMGVLGFCGSKYLEVYISYMVYELQLFLESSGGEGRGERI